MMTSEQKILLSVLADFVNNRPSKTINDFDEEKLFCLAKSQCVDGILYYQTHINSAFISFNNTIFNATNQQKLIDGLHNEFKNHSIPFMVFKGMEIAKYYSMPQLRSMGDIDILFHQKDKVKASEIIESFGFAYQRSPDGKEAAKPTDHEWIYFKNDFEIEIHHRLLYNTPANELSHIAYTDKAWEYSLSDDGICYHLEPEFQFIYTLLHLRKHFLYSGVNVRFFLDLAIMIKNAQMDWENIRQTLSELNILAFAKQCFLLIDNWFDISCPLTPEKSDNEFIKHAAELILNGNSMSDKEVIQNNRYLNTFKKEKTTSFGKIKMTFLSVFPPYSRIKERYTKIEALGIFGYFILPLMWLHRGIESVAQYSAGGVLKLFIKPITLNKEMEKREEILKKWGL